MSNPLIVVKHLSKQYQIRDGNSFFAKKYMKAIDDISFTIQRGECFGLVGESGCGKSTTGRVLLNLVEATSGYVSFGDTVLFDSENRIHLGGRRMRRMRRDMQIIFQDPYASLDPRMSVGKIIAEGIEKQGVAHGKKAMILAGECLEKCGLSKDNLIRYPNEFSGGQRQRIGIARALSLCPQFVVADEPIASLDVSIQAQNLNLMSDLKDEFGLTYLFISHDLGIVKYFCDHIAVMYLGKIVESGTQKDIFENPRHPYTKTLLQSVMAGAPNKKRTQLTVSDDIPSATNPPSGCKFRTRCAFAKAVCGSSVPDMENAGEEHSVACHRWREPLL